MKIANVKGMIAKGMLVALAAGAFVMASPAKAEAQGFGVGVQFGGPAFYGPRPIYRPYDRFEFERRREFLRHEEWVRAHRFDHPGFYR